MITLPDREVLSRHEAKQKSPVELAFIGDAVYELLVREHISLTHDAPASALHNMAIAYVRAEAQHSALDRISGSLTDEEAEMA
ncbi:MAG: ribonuclease III domain-containing protein, partial [Bacillota bacterium]